MEESIITEMIAYLGALAHRSFSAEDSRGRREEMSKKKDYESSLVPAADPFAIDIIKARSSPTYRRLANKMDVFPSPTNYHIRTRLTHTEEVVYIGRLIGGVLGLNTNLIEAIGVTHDFGHTPMGHNGEKFVDVLMKATGGFKHENFGVVVSQKLERNGKGLNLTYETLNGALHHSLNDIPEVLEKNWPLEFLVDIYADKFAYVFADCNDVIRSGFMKKKDLPKYLDDLGSNRHERIYGCVKALIKESAEKECVCFSDSETAQKFFELRRWMHENVYWYMDEFERGYLQEKLARAYEKISKVKQFKGINPVLPLCLMTDNDILSLAEGELDKGSAIFELIPAMRKWPDLDMQDPDLSWALV